MHKTRVFLALSVLVFAMATGCRQTPEARAAKAMANGKGFLEKRDYPRAVLEFKNAIDATPRDAEAYYQIGMAFAGTRDLQAAVNAFQKALSLNPKHYNAQLELSRIMAASLNPDVLEDAEGRLQALLQGAPAADPNALQTLAMTEMRLGKMDSAVEHLNQALAAAPQSLSNSILMAQAMLSQRDVKGAEDVLTKAVAAAPKAAPPKIILAAFYTAQGRLAESEVQLRQALDIDSNNIQALMDLARIQMGSGRKQEAEQLWKRLSALPNVQTRHSYALFLLQEGRKDEALREFERIAKGAPNDRSARSRLVAAYRSLGKTAEAHRVLDAALNKNEKDMDALLQRGELYLGEGKLVQAETDLNQVLHAQPGSAEIHYVISKLHEKRGSALLQRQELAEALKLNPLLLPVRLEYAQLLVGTNAAGSALTVLNEAPLYQRKTIPVIVARNWALWTTGDMKELRAGIDEGLRLQRNTDLLIQDGLWRLKQRDFAGAKTSIEMALKANPQDVRALEAVRQIYVLQKQSKLALDKVKEYAAQSPNSAAVQSFLGYLLVASGEKDQARNAFASAQKADPSNAVADKLLVQLDFMDGNLSSARSRLQNQLKTNPTDQTARMWLGDVEATMGDATAALNEYQKVLQNNPQHPDALNNVGYLLAAGKRADEGLKFAEKAHEMDPNNPDYADTLGWIYYQKGLYSMAVRHLEPAAASKRNIVWRYHLAMAYAKAGDNKKAKSTLDAALKENSKVPEAKEAQQVVER